MRLVLRSRQVAVLAVLALPLGACADQYAGGAYEGDPPYEGGRLNGGPDIDCGEIPARDFPTPPGDPDNLDADGDGIACESY